MKSNKPLLIVGYGEAMLDVIGYVDGQTIFFHVGAQKEPSTVYAVSRNGELCKTLSENTSFKETECTDKRLCKFETNLRVEKLKNVFAEHELYFLPTDPEPRKEKMLARKMLAQ